MNQITFAQKVPFIFAMGAAIDLGAVGDAFKTPDVMAYELGDLARLQFVRGVLRVNAVASGNSTAQARMSLFADSVEIYGRDVAFTAGEVSFEQRVSLQSLTGAERLTVVVEVTTDDAGVTAALDARLDVDSPVVIMA